MFCSGTCGLVYKSSPEYLTVFPPIEAHVVRKEDAPELVNLGSLGSLTIFTAADAALVQIEEGTGLQEVHNWPTSHGLHTYTCPIHTFKTPLSYRSHARPS